MSEEKQLKEVGLATEEQLAKWKLEHGNVKTIELFIDDENGEIVEKSYGYLKTPDRDTVAMSLSLLNQQKPLQAGEVILGNCWIGGDERMKLQETQLGISAAFYARSIPVFYAGGLKK